MGLEPTASLVLSQGGLPVAYRAVCAPSRSRTCNRSGLSRAALSVGVSGQVVPDGIEPPLPGCRPGVVAAGPRDYLFHSGSRGTRTHNGVTAPVFETGSSSGRMTSVLQVAGAGIEPTPERSERPVLPLDDPAIVFPLLPPCAHMPSWHECSVASSGGRNRTYGLLIQSQASLPTATTPEYSFRFKSALRELNSPRQFGRLVPRPLGQGHAQRKE